MSNLPAAAKMAEDAIVQTLFHEIGHCLIDVWGLPATGREDEHSFSKSRFYDIICVVNGTNLSLIDVIVKLGNRVHKTPAGTQAVLALAGAIFKNCWGLPYNSEGNYFDENSAVVYHDQSVLVYGTAAIVLLFLTVLPGYMTAKQFRATL